MFKVDNLTIGFRYDTLPHPTLTDGDRRYTHCIIKDENKEVISVGWAIFNIEDEKKGKTFKKSEGRKKALAKAMYGFTKEYRTHIWEEYFKVVKENNSVVEINK